MSEALDSWGKVEAFALSIPGTQSTTSWGAAAVKVAANGRAFEQAAAKNPVRTRKK